MKKLILPLILIIFFCLSHNAKAQITANGASGYFPTTYSQGYLNSGGQNDIVYVFCGTQNQANIGSLSVNAPGCSVAWYTYNGVSFVANGQTGSTINNLGSGCYMARVTCGGVTTCYKAWVWVNQSYVEVGYIAPGCETFTLNGNVQILDNQFIINDPPSPNFTISANTYIKVCFWANHTYVSDIGFYLKSPGSQTAEPGNNGVVQLCPAASDWGPNAQQGSWTGIPWSVLGCSDPNDENTVCNSGNHVNNFCFTSHNSPGGTPLPAGNPTYTPCVCDLPTPLTGTFASVGPWSTIYGANAGDPGWSVQIYDCEAIDAGALTRTTITFIDQTDCGQAIFVYDSGPINSQINDNSCNAATASLYVVPPPSPAGSYTVTSQIIDQEWTCSALPGWTSNNLNTQIIAGTGNFPPSTCNYTLTVYEKINVPGNIVCSSSASRLFETMPANATISPVSPKCTNSAPVQLVAVDGGGTWSCTTVPAAIQNGIFYPEIAGPGTHTINYDIVGPCSDSDQITITVYDDISVSNFVDTCNNTSTAFVISFSVTGSQGGPAPFLANWGEGFQNFYGTFVHTFNSPSTYNITVTDAHACSQYVFSGYHYCECVTYAGTMVSLDPLLLCANQCTGTNQHNGNHALDGDDILEFILHNGSYPPTIYARGSTSNFCMNSVPGNAQFGVMYYISAIAGNNVNGHVDASDICYNQAVGRPVMWYPNPIAHINGTVLDTCGMSIHLSAEPPGPGMMGYWTADASFVPINGTSASSPEIDVIVNNYGDVTFTWTLTNNVCSGTDNILVHFLQTPNAYAGSDITVCGSCADLNAVFSLPTSNGQWSGSGTTFMQSTNPQTQVCVNNYGTYVLTWTEYNGDCYDQDNVVVTFLQEPTPTITLSHDSVCGVYYNLQVYNNNNPGHWTATDFNTGQAVSVTYINGTNQYSPNAHVVIGEYPGLFRTVIFEWTETSQYGSIQCHGSASTTITFAREPSASVGVDDHDQVCGNSYTFSADTLGSGWAFGTWIGSHIIATWDDINDPFATVTIDPLGSFGDSAHVQVAFLWVMSNYGCVSIDTMYVTFYQAPIANAGINDSICGFKYTLHSYYSIAPSNSYSPTGRWTYLNGPSTTGVNIADINNPITEVSVSQEGTYRFIWRETNTLMPSCYTQDTVEIKFIEIPIIDAGSNFNVCGQHTQLNATTAGFDGSWVPMGGIVWGDPYDPHTSVASQTFGSRVFWWQEANGMCTARDSVIVTFWKKPTPQILTAADDTTQCGLCFRRLQAGNPGAGISTSWRDLDEPNATFTQANVMNPDTVCVTQYGVHRFIVIQETGVESEPAGFCADTAGPISVRFIRIPEANAGPDTLFCGYNGKLNATPSYGTGTWTTPSTANITFNDPHSPNTTIQTNVLNPSDAHPNFLLVWTEDNSRNCTDKDTVFVFFARIPSGDFEIKPPKCFGEYATLIAREDTLSTYNWQFTGIHTDSISGLTSQGGDYRHTVRWHNTDTAHFVTLVSRNHWGCESPVFKDTVFEPPIPKYSFGVFPDTCLLGKGAVLFSQDSIANSFEWLDIQGTPITPTHVYDQEQYNIPAGSYRVSATYTTFNTPYYSFYISNFGTAYCYDTLTINIVPVGLIEAEFEVSMDIDIHSLVAPEAEVWYVNLTNYDDIRTRCVWHFGDGASSSGCDAQVQHIYTEAGCYEPYLVVMSRDIPECRDTARLDFCIPVDAASKLEVPNIFTPNGDGHNDFFQVKAQTLKEFNGVIVNRWGRAVYEWTNWQDMEAGWDGKLSSGSLASPGVYFYIIKAVGIDKIEYELQGPLHLMREK